MENNIEEQNIAEEQVKQEEVTSNPMAKPNIEHPLSGGFPLLNRYFGRHQKLVTYLGGGVVILLAGILIYVYAILGPQEEEAKRLIFHAQRYFEVDSMKLALNGDGRNPGFLEITDDYSMTKTGNLAKYYAGIALLKTGKYEDAIDYLKGFKTTSHLIGPMSLGAIGDAYSMLKQYDDAASYYMKAAKRDDNQLTAPYFYKKAGLVYEQLKQYDDAVDVYQRIKDKYKDSQQGIDIDKFLARAQAGASSK